MKFALFFLGEYAAMITGSAIIVTLFFGGWHFPGIPDGSHGWIFGLINIAVFFAKVAAVIFVFMWVRWTLPRFRYDQLMRLGWLFFFEIALVNIFIVAAILSSSHLAQKVFFPPLNLSILAITVPRPAQLAGAYVFARHRRRPCHYH
jgi:NADH-quinone oxidoreductase subunit H